MRSAGMSEGGCKGIEHHLAVVRRRIRRAQATRGGLIAGSALLGGLLVVMVVDLALAPLPPAARWVVFGLWMLVVLVAAQRGFAPLFRGIGLVQIARWLEGRHPEIEERISTALELSGDQRVSPELVAALTEAAAIDAGQVDAAAEVDAVKTTRRWRWPVVVCAAVLLLALVVRPGDTMRLLVRAVAPFSDAGTAGASRFELSPGDVEVMEGDAIEIRARLEGGDGPLELVMDFERGERVTQPMTAEGAASTYRLDPARESFRYRVRAGRVESDAFTATVWPMPRLLDPGLQLDFPDYTEIAAEEHPLGRELEAVAGTRVSLDAATNTPVESAWLEVDGRRRAEGEVETLASAGRIRIAWTLQAEDRGRAVVRLRHRLGRSVEAAAFELRTVEDLAPRVTVLSPSRRELRVRPDEVIDLRYEVVEDFGVAKLAIEAEAGRKGSVEDGQVLPERFGPVERGRFRGGAEVSVGALRSRLGEAREIHVRVVAEDARPEASGGPGRGESEWLILRVDKAAESLGRQQLRAEHEEARDGLREAIHATRVARERMDWKREEWLDEVDRPDVEKVREEVRERLAEAREQLDELSERMEEGIHAAKADEVREASESVGRALEEFEELPLQDDRSRREEKLDAARSGADEALEKMEAIREALERDRSKVEDLARMEELAQQQRELAREVAEQAGRAGEEASKDWRHRQQQVAAALRQQLSQRPEARQQALEAQAEASNALADQAREQAAMQQELGELAESMSSPESPDEETLREQLAAAQAAMAEQAGNVAREASEEGSAASEALPVAARHAQEAAGSAAEAEMERAAEAARQAAEAMRKAAEAAAGVEPGAEHEASPSAAGRGEVAELAGMADRQDHLAAAAEALAAGDTEAAAEHLEAGERGQPSPSMADALREALEAEQAAIAHQAREQLADARQAGGEMADVLPEAAAAAQQAREALGEGPMEQAAGQAAAAGEAMSQAATEAGAQAADAAASGRPLADAMQQAAELGSLAERQQQVAEAAASLASGDLEDALGGLQAMRAEAASQLAQDIAAIPEVFGDATAKAGREAGRAAEQASSAARQSAEGRADRAAEGHAESSAHWAEAASSLEHAAEQLAEQASEAAGQPGPPSLAPVGSQALAQAFQGASRAGSSPRAAEAAGHATRAARALGQAARAGRAQMQGRPQPGPPGPPGDAAGDRPEEGPRPEQADPGVPPELARLGISAGDWEKIQASLNSDVGGGGDAALPEDYRALVREYFEGMAK